MRVLGIDCGTEYTGYGVISSDGVTHTMLTCGTIRTTRSHALAARLLEIAGTLRKVIHEFQPDSGAVESVFYAVNVKTALKLAHVRGVALLTLAEAGLEVGEYSPLEIKTSVVGYGRAEKSQVQMMVRSLLHVGPEVDSPDAADALAAAICHATHATFQARLGAGR
jgi:crossover junction endodeoxyribonuclease RuvC